MTQTYLLKEGLSNYRTHNFLREPILQYRRDALPRLACMVWAPGTEPGYNPLLI